ncbi:MAG: Crp/Fnr family transcriptional regulator [Comamonas sp.]|nr:Crp/Fnr family transcriptional regulator [Comamonas sp.]
MSISPLMLADTALFAQAPPLAVQFAASHMHLQHLRRRELVSPTQPFDGLGLVLQGEVQAMDMTSDGKEVALLSASAGHSFGQHTLLSQHPLPLQWMASQAATSLALMAREHALTLLHQHPGILLAVATLVSTHASQMLRMQKIQAIHPVSARICAWLLHHSQANGQVQLPTHAQLAWQLNTTRESITRMLQKLLSEAILRRDADTWHILQPQALQALSGGHQD